jgi:hypothetical protein
MDRADRFYFYDKGDHAAGVAAPDDPMAIIGILVGLRDVKDGTSNTFAEPLPDDRICAFPDVCFGDDPLAM